MDGSPGSKGNGQRVAVPRQKQTTRCGWIAQALMYKPRRVLSTRFAAGERVSRGCATVRKPRSRTCSAPPSVTRMRAKYTHRGRVCLASCYHMRVASGAGSPGGGEATVKQRLPREASAGRSPRTASKLETRCNVEDILAHTARNSSRVPRADGVCKDPSWLARPASRKAHRSPTAPVPCRWPVPPFCNPGVLHSDARTIVLLHVLARALVGAVMRRGAQACSSSRLRWRASKAGSCKRAPHKV